MNFDVDTEKLIALETIIHVEDLIDELMIRNHILDHEDMSNLRDDVLQAIRIELRKKFK